MTQARPAGLEPATCGLEVGTAGDASPFETSGYGSPEPGWAQNGQQFKRDAAAIDPDLRTLIECWPMLPEAFKQAILALAKGRPPIEAPE